MPRAFPVGRERYVQYLRTDPNAPRREPARTHEVKGQKRHGEGVAYRLFGPHAVVLGQWTGLPMTADEQEIYRQVTMTPEGDELARANPWGRLIQPEEIDGVAAQVFREKVETGWQPPPWHWRFYYERVQYVFSKIGAVDVAAYNEVRFTPRRFVQILWDRLKMRLFPIEEPVSLDDWRAGRTADGEGTDGLAL